MEKSLIATLLPTSFDIQRAGIYLQVKPLGRGIAKLLQYTSHRLGDVVRYLLLKLHLAIHHHAPVPEIEDLELFESCQV